MALVTKVVAHTDAAGTTYTLTVSEANISIGARRFRLGEEARKHISEQEGPPPIELTWILTNVYPNLIAATVSGEIVPAGQPAQRWPPTFQEFMDLPEQLWDKWTAAVRELNPHWYPQEALAPKAPTPSTSG